MDVPTTLQFLFDNFGKTVTLLIIGGLFVSLIVIWAFVHISARPDSDISLLWGLVTYKKGFEKPPPKFEALNIIEDQFEMLWRVKSPPNDWINMDVASMSERTVDRILLGPFHAKCKSNLSYFDTSTYARGAGYCVRRSCRPCNAELLPGSGPLSRSETKTHVLKLIQQAYLNGEKIKDGMKI